MTPEGRYVGIDYFESSTMPELRSRDALARIQPHEKSREDRTRIHLRGVRPTFGDFGAGPEADVPGSLHSAPTASRLNIVTSSRKRALRDVPATFLGSLNRPRFGKAAGTGGKLQISQMNASNGPPSPFKGGKFFGRSG
jgi:hypothetical protein